MALTVDTYVSMKHYNGATNFVKTKGQLMLHLEVLQFDPKFLACKMVLNNCSSYIKKIHFRRKFLNAALNRFGVVLVVYMCLYIEVMHVHFECRRFIHLHKYILVLCFKRAYIHLCVHVE